MNCLKCRQDILSGGMGQFEPKFYAFPVYSYFTGQKMQCNNVDFAGKMFFMRKIVC